MTWELVSFSGTKVGPDGKCAHGKQWTGRNQEWCVRCYKNYLRRIRGREIKEGKVSHWEKMEESTLEHMNKPQKGDRFHEMYSFWVYVWDILPDGSIVTHEASPPCEFPKDATVKIYPSKAAFKKRFQYPSIPDKFWVKWENTSDYHAEGK